MSKLHLESMVKQFMMGMPGIWGVKDTNSIHLFANKTYTALLGLENNQAITGLRDADFPCGVANLANDFKKQDNLIVQHGKVMHFLDVHPFATGWQAFIVTKKPLFDEQHKPLGILYHGIDVINTWQHDLSKLITHTQLAGNCQQPLNPSARPNLTTSEEEVLFFILRGYTAKRTAQLLKRSQRTIEGHINNLKRAFVVNSKHELIEKAIGCGCLSLLPQNFLHHQISIAINHL